MQASLLWYALVTDLETNPTPSEYEDRHHCLFDAVGDPIY